MSEPNLQELFEKDRFPKSSWQLFTLLLYSPIGLVLATLRLFIGYQALLAAAVLPKMFAIRSVILRIMCFVLGIIVQQENEPKKDKAKVIVSNCVTQLDSIAAHLATGSITWELPSPLAWAMGVIDMTDGHRPTVSKLKAHLEKKCDPLFLQPEEATTSGKVGLLKFAPWMAKLSETVQPLVIKVWRPPIFELAPDVLGSSFAINVFWFLFSPYTVFTLRYLPVVSRETDETDEKMTERVESAIASYLGIPTTSHTASDKAEYEKRYLIEYRQPVLVTSAGQSGLSYPEMQRMVSQVNEVLPYVPIDAVLDDLSRTHSVDITISNILEGSVPYTPIQEPPHPVEPAPSCTLPVRSQPVMQSISQGQGKVISFMERKAKLIADARRRYIEKHGLVDTWAE